MLPVHEPVIEFGLLPEQLLWHPQLAQFLMMLPNEAPPHFSFFCGIIGSSEAHVTTSPREYAPLPRPMSLFDRNGYISSRLDL
jgi:hypothetical protein